MEDEPEIAAYVEFKVCIPVYADDDVIADEDCIEIAEQVLLDGEFTYGESSVVAVRWVGYKGEQENSP